MSKEINKQELKAVPKGEAAVLAEFKSKKNNIDLIITNNNFDIENDKLIDGVTTHLDIKGYSLNGPYIIVQEHDDTQYVYRAERFDLIKLYVTE